MIEVRNDGRDVCFTLTHDVWQMEGPGTLCLTRNQAQRLRVYLNAWAVETQAEDIDEDG